MKKIRCPKCDEAILFDDERYEPGNALVFECPGCHKQFRIRIPAAKSPNTPNEDEEEERSVYAHLVVIENAFHFKQEIPLYEGDNIVGRYVKGTSANAAIKTVDPSIDTTHCVVNVKLDKNGNPRFTLRDAPSGTGTFLMNEILGDRERVLIEHSAIITIGATTMILRVVGKDTEEA